VTLFEDTNPRDLLALLRDVHDGNSVLPDFQRDFVWEPSAVRELIVSIVNGYPAGSILRVRDTQRLFAIRPIEGVKTAGNGHTFLVLDGQQRLTSLYQAFYGIGSHRYFVDIQAMLDGAEFDESLSFGRANQKRIIRKSSIEYQAKNLVLPLSVFAQRSGGFEAWVQAVVDRYPDDEQLKLMKRLHQMRSTFVDAVERYQFPVVTLSEKTSIDALCTIFETLNRTGVKLTVFELLTARYWAQGLNLRELWDAAVNEHQILSDFDVDPYYILQGISLVSRKIPSVTRKNVLDLSVEAVKEWWGPVVLGMVQGLQLLREDCGVPDKKWMPYTVLTLPLAAALTSFAGSKSPQLGSARTKLATWFWCSVFSQAYDQGAGSQAERDYNQLKAWLEEGAAPDSVSDGKFDSEVLFTTVSRREAVYRGVICLVLKDGARDFHSHAPITQNLIIEQQIDDHHIFPKGFLALGQTSVPDWARVDSVLNRTLIDRSTNRRIGARAPSDYLAEMRGTSGFPFELVLESHLLPAGPDSALMQDRFGDFLEWRRSRISDAIHAATGWSALTRVEDDTDA
jgi:hypothetical protein